MSELKPCPFCGGKPLRWGKADGPSVVLRHIECARCHISTPEHSDPERIEEIWNTRTGTKMQYSDPPTVSMMIVRDEISADAMKEWMDAPTTQQPYLLVEPHKFDRIKATNILKRCIHIIDRLTERQSVDGTFDGLEIDNLKSDARAFIMDSESPGESHQSATETKNSLTD